MNGFWLRPNPLTLTGSVGKTLYDYLFSFWRTNLKSCTSYYLCLCISVQFVWGLAITHRYINYTLVSVLTTFFTDSWDDNTLLKAAILSTLRQGLSRLTLLRLTYLSDAYGRHQNVILFSSAVYVTGLVLLGLTTYEVIPQGNLLFYTFVVAMIGIGKTGSQPILEEFFKCQLRSHETEQEEAATKEDGNDRTEARFKVWKIIAWFLSLLLIIFFSQFEWKVNLTLSASLMAVSCFLFWLGTSQYHPIEPVNTPITVVKQVFCAAYYKRNLQYPQTPRKFFRNEGNHTILLPDLGIGRWLDKAAIIEEPPSSSSTTLYSSFSSLSSSSFYTSYSSFSASSSVCIELEQQQKEGRLCPPSSSSSSSSFYSSYPSFSESSSICTTHLEQQQKEGRLCTVSQVTQTKLLLTMVPMWIVVSVGFGLVRTTAETFFSEQANNMESGIDITALLMFETVSSSTASNLCDMLFKRIHNGKKRRCWMITRVCLGMVMYTLCFTSAWKVEAHKLSVVQDNQLQLEAKDKIPVSTWILLPQFLLSGCAEALAMDAVVEYYKYQVPESMEGYADVFNSFFNGIGSILSIFCLLGFKRWFGRSLNSSRLDKYYMFITVFSSANFFISLGVLIWIYIFKLSNIIVDDAIAGDLENGVDQLQVEGKFNDTSEQEVRFHGVVAHGFGIGPPGGQDSDAGTATGQELEPRHLTQL